MINKDSFAKAQDQQEAAKTADPEKLLKKINKKLKKSVKEDPSLKSQYNAIKGVVNNREVAILKRYFGLTEYQSSHQMRWSLINAYNGADEE